MEIPRTDYNRQYNIISLVWNSRIPGKGTLARLLSRLLIPKPKGRVISKNIFGFDLLLDPLIDNGVERSLYCFGAYEQGTLKFMEENLKQDSVFFDIGANIGLMSIYASYRVGKTGRVFSFEANPETVNILQYNIDLNKIENITVVDKAAGNKNGTIKIYNNWNVNRGGATLIKPQQESSSFDVDLIKIDSVSEYIDLNISMIKIDVEGFEMDVLMGLEKILQKKDAPALIIECSEDRNNNYSSVYALFDFIKSVNSYKIYKLSRTKERIGKLVEITTREDLPKHDNIFCIKN